MGLLRPAREMLSRYRKRSRRSFDGSVPGAPSAHYRRSTTAALGTHRSSDAIHHDLYNHGTPSEYHPGLNHPAAQATDYEPYDAWDAVAPISSTPPVRFRNLDHVDDELNPPTYEHSAAIGAFLFQRMQEEYEAQREALGTTVSPDRIQQGPDIDNIGPTLESVTRTPEEEERAHFFDLVDALGHLRTVLPEDHPDIVNLRTSVHDMLERTESWIPEEDFGPQDWQSNLGTDDPYKIDPFEEAQQAFDEQLQMTDQAFESPQLAGIDDQLTDIFDDQQAGLNMMLEGYQPDDPFTEGHRLEEIVEHADPFNFPEQSFMEPEMMMGETQMDVGVPEMDGNEMGVVHDEIDQAIDQLSEPDPLQMPYDQPMMPEYMLDPEMQYMTPGAMSMGPMGPMPGPAPGF